MLKEFKLKWLIQAEMRVRRECQEIFTWERGHLKKALRVNKN